MAVLGIAVLDAAFIYGIVALPICALAVALRFHATRRAGLKTTVEDWLALAAYVSFLVEVIMDLIFITTIGGRPLKDLSMNESVRISKLAYAQDPFGPLNQLFAKMSLLYLYHRLFGIDRLFARCIWATGTAQVLWTIVTILVRCLRCQPLSAAWDPRVRGDCVDAKRYLVGSETTNSTIDFIMVGLALWMVHGLHIRTSTKFKLSGIFVLGGLSGVIGFIRIGQSYANAGSDYNLTIPIWRFVQESASIICCCAPVYKGVLRLEGFRRLVSNVGHSISLRVLRSKPSRVFSETTPPGSRKTSSTENIRKDQTQAAYHNWPSQGGNAWTSIDVNPRLGSANSDIHSLKTVRMQRSFDIV
ncbi:hypothetical protein F5B20DRAFT_152276 [Whalleya microplaca]|nr:hypothetical protein F5B20DRAFT_152276 [Whalleya microplaca]